MILVDTTRIQSIRQRQRQRQPYGIQLLLFLWQLAFTPSNFLLYVKIENKKHQEGLLFDMSGTTITLLFTDFFFLENLSSHSRASSPGFSLIFTFQKPCLGNQKSRLAKLVRPSSLHAAMVIASYLVSARTWSVAINVIITFHFDRKHIHRLY